MRLIYPFPLIHTQFSAEATYRSHRFGEHHDRAAGWLLRAQTGFSLLSFDLGVGRDHGFNGGEELANAWVVRTTVSLSGPLLRVPLLRHLERRVVLKARDVPMNTCPQKPLGNVSGASSVRQ